MIAGDTELQMMVMDLLLARPAHDWELQVFQDGRLDLRLLPLECLLRQPKGERPVEALVIDRHRSHPVVKVRLLTGEEIWVHENDVGHKRPLQVGDVLEEVSIELEPRILGAKLKEPSTVPAG